ncbi:hypothetical protein CDL12_16802 [Handroanthus impetiginosus]|uniref:Uncharacterized protein n=1 Tax=Handroanthus impetiginosus TaxID=429701 RepID=A0A2G9GZA5_9LAMI|nr:hypothetical protein CDL12_16802 [Handroanthus impetiginosus]
MLRLYPFMFAFICSLIHVSQKMTYYLTKFILLNCMHILIVNIHHKSSCYNFSFLCPPEDITIVFYLSFSANFMILLLCLYPI